MRLRRLLAAAVAAASLLSSAAQAEDELPSELLPTRPLPEVANMLAFEYCPKILGGAIEMTGSWEIQQLGFGSDILDRTEPEFDYPLFMIEAERFDGKLAYASRVENGCEVIVSGKARKDAREAFEAKMAALPVFEPAPTLSSKNVQAWSATLQNGWKLNARLKDAKGEVIMQLSVDGCSTCKR